MSTFAALPLILVSAKSEEAANNFISQLIDNEPEEAAGGRVWRIHNKYYRCDVRLEALADGAPPPDPAAVEGHVIYLAEDESTAEAGARLAAGARAAVRVLAAEARALAAPLEAWAARRRLEPVPLRAPPPAGLSAARAALHAHVWPGLVRHEDGEQPEEWDAAQWGAALGALEGVRALRGEERRAAAEGLVAAFCRALGEDM